MQRVQRIIVHDRTDAYVGEIDPQQLIDATSKEEVNGEHSLTITTLQQLEKTDRLLLRDGTGRWHEYVVLGIEERHTDGGAVAHEYYCVWSLQYDLSATFVNDLYGCGYNPGRASTPQPARRALECALEGTKRWQIGTITQLTESSASFYRRSGWEGLQTTVERWGGEIDATIDVSTTGVVGRYVNLLAHTGQSEATRRFDYGHDVSGIRRTVSDEIWPCRIVPLGKSVETEAGGYTRRKSIDSVNDGIPWVEDASAVPLTRVPDGEGGWEYPTLIVKNDTYEDPEELKAWAVEHVSEYCRPIVSYTADVVQFERAGMSPHGVSLGDEVVVVDRDFCEGGLRIAARVVKVEEDLLDPSQTKLTIGNAQETLGGQLGSISREVSQLTEQAGNAGEYQATAGYLSALLGRLNDEANATGGYTYITEGQGIRTYDRAVTDPLVGAEATKVVEVKGGTIRIADSRTSGGDWDWKTVFTSGHIAAELVTAAQIVAGYIGSSSSGNYWDLDNGTLTVNNGTISAGTIHGGTLVMGGANNVNGAIQVLDASRNVVGTFDKDGLSATGTIILAMPGYTSGSKHYAKMGQYTVKGETGNTLNLRGLTVYTEGETYNNNPLIGISALTGAGQISDYRPVIITNRDLDIIGGTSSARAGSIKLGSSGSRSGLIIETTSSTDRMALEFGQTTITGKAKYNGSSYPDWVRIGNSVSSKVTNAYFIVDTFSITGKLTATGTKSRLVETEDYGNRLLYCYETPSPMFGDMGSGAIGEDGLCYVEVDDMFTETANSGIGYQVFLQKCGRGDLWVAEKRLNYFVVEGTPGLAFDWEMKAHQTEYENTRMEEYRAAEELEEEGWLESPEDAYGDFVSEIESLYE